jgi:plastocyanin
MRTVVASLLLGPLALAACFSDRPEPVGPEFAVPDVECSVVIPEPDAGEAIVAIRDFAFHPAALSVPQGTTVTWINCEDATLHTTTSDTEVWDSGGLSPGETFTLEFNGTGAFPYHCTPHPFMEGSVEVTEP